MVAREYSCALTLRAVALRLISGSKMRSDDIISRDPEAAARAHILVAPPGTEQNDYLPSSSSRGRGRARGRGRRGTVGGGR